MAISFSKHIKSVFQSPFFLPLIFTLILFPFLPINYNKYKTRIINVIPSNYRIRYDDLDNDGESENLTFMDMINASGLMIRNASGYIEQWNVKGSFDFLYKTILYISGDYDNDGIKEVYLFSISGDSILMHSIPDFRSPFFGQKNRFISKVGAGIRKPDPFIINAEMSDLDSDGKMELIFGIGTGFSLYPRRVYAYYIDKDSLVSSPESSAANSMILQADIDRDGVKEIIPYGAAPSNCDTPLVKFHDNSSWLMILDNKLNFKYEPQEYPGRYSLLFPLFFENGANSTFAVYQNLREPGKKSKIRILNNEVQEIQSAELENCISVAFMTQDSKMNCEIVIGQNNGTFLVLNKYLKLLREIHSGSIAAQTIQIDFDLDGKKEIIIPSYSKGELTIYREGLEYPSSVSMDNSLGWIEYVAVERRKEGEPVLFIQTPSNNYQIQYVRNKFYLANFAIFPGIYACLLIFALLIQRTQRNKLQEKYQNEKKIAELQLSLIRNQLDPHFTFNAVNSVIYSINNNDSEVASDHLRKFASLYRTMLMSASSARRTLAEEMDFCEDYLYLEKIRLSKKLDYSFDLAENVDCNNMVPKMILQVFAENSVKHGIFHLKSGGKLEIRIRMLRSDLIIEIQDNGIGREASGKMAYDKTGKGLVLMKEYFQLYYSYFNEKISFEITDLKDIGNSSTGTLVKIVIENFALQKMT